MKNLFQMRIDEREPSFQSTADKMGLIPNVIEKDFWVVWTLWRLFEQPELRPFLTFKGGTSLSKVFGVIKRFSEDLDLSIEKDFFGFGEKKAPEHAPSRKKKSKALQGLSAACSKYVQTELLDLLKNDFSRYLQNKTAWDITIDKIDPDGQTLLFAYPTLYSGGSNYVRSTIKLELGARSEHWPVSEQALHSYVLEHLSDKVEEPTFKIRVLNIERTFWEKATILHAYAHVPKDKRIPKRLARHYYDMHSLLQAPVKEIAAKDLTLLDRVVQHKINYFTSAWSKFETAKKGTLKLIPPEHLKSVLKSDYTEMRDMFFEEPPAWEMIMESIGKFEMDFNRS